jgi:hypothetical protein
MALQPISQSGFIRGMNASTSHTLQPKGSVARLSNMLLTHRGSLVTCHGSELVFSPLGTNQFFSIGAYQPTVSSVYVTGLGQTTGRQGVAPVIGGSSAIYAGVGGVVAVRVNPTSGVFGSYGTTTYTTGGNHNITVVGTLVNITSFADSSFNGNFIILTIPATNQFTVTQIGPNASSTGGSVSTGLLNPATTYFYKVVAVDKPIDTAELLSIGLITAGTTLPSNEIALTPGGANNQTKITIANAPLSAAGFLLYRSTSSGTEKLVSGYVPNTNPGGLVTLWDLGNALPFPNIAPPVSNTTSPTTFYSMTGTGTGNTYSAANAIADLPAASFFSVQPYPGQYDGTYLFSGVNIIWTPFGGVQGTIMPISYMIQFLDKQILILGNGYPPMQFDGTKLTALTGGSGTAPPGAAAGIVYAGSLWVGNTAPYDLPDGINGPSALRMSNSNNPNSWTDVNSAFLGHGDGTQITGMAVFTIAESGIIPTGSLVVFKDFTTYQITGVFGAANFTIQQAQTDMGCIAPRTIQFVPGFGIVRLTHLGWAVFDGVRDRLLSEELRPFIFLDQSQQTLDGNSLNTDINPLNWAFAYRCWACQTVAPAMYVATYPTLDNFNNIFGHMSTAFVFDLTLRAWTTLNWFNGIGDLVNAMIMLRPGDSLPVTLFADNFGHIQRWQAGDENWAAHSGSIPVQWSVRTAEVIGKSPTDRFMIRRLLVRGTNNAIVPTNFILPTVLPVLDRVSQLPAVTALMRTYTNPGLGGPGQEFQLDVGMQPLRVATSAACIITGSGRVELDSFDWMVVPRPTGRPITIS